MEDDDENEEDSMGGNDDDNNNGNDEEEVTVVVIGPGKNKRVDITKGISDNTTVVEKDDVIAHGPLPRPT